ncbi:MAG: DUF3137 domain-containing protein [Lachnospiraceae bacterium]|nr:DUF3137 domain-containing protein [Lachnospiraceae bacterium]
MNNTGWEELQREQNGIRILALCTGGFILFGFILFFWQAMSFRMPLFGVLFIIMGFVFGILVWKRYTGFKSLYKTLVVNKAAEGLFDRYIYDPNAGFSSDEIRATGIMAMGNRYKSEDTVEGIYKGVTFRRADIYIAQHTSNGKSSHTTIYIQGTWIEFDYNKSFNTDLQILSKDFSFSNKKSSRLFTRAAERRHAFQTESEEFNRLFTCTCQDENEAFYLLTPRLMQMLQLLKTEIGRPFMLGFVNNRLHFVISSHADHMEPSVFGSLDFKVEVEQVRRELMIIRNVIDSLAMDRRLFE